MARENISDILYKAINEFFRTTFKPKIKHDDMIEVSGRLKVSLRNKIESEVSKHNIIESEKFYLLPLHIIKGYRDNIFK